MDELIINYDYINGKLSEYNEYLTSFENIISYIRNSSLGSSGDTKIITLTGQLLDLYNEVNNASSQLSTAWGEYLEEFANAEHKLASLNADGCEAPEYDGEIAQVVDSSIIPVLRGEMPPLRAIGYNYSTGDDFMTPIEAQYNFSNGTNCTDTCWRLLRDEKGIYLPWSTNANKWDDQWAARGGLVLPIAKDGKGGYTNTNKIQDGDVICIESIGENAGKYAGHVIYLNVNEDGSVVTREGGASFGHMVTRNYDSLDELFSHYNTSGGNVSVLSMSRVEG